MWTVLRAKLGYWLARQLFGYRWAQQNQRVWEWMQNQYVRMANTGHKEAQAFYGHLLYHKGQGKAARYEGLRYLRMAGEQGDEKAAYQVGMHFLQEADKQQAKEWFEKAEALEHPMAEVQLNKLRQDEA